MKDLRIFIFSCWLYLWVDLLPNLVGSGRSNAYNKLQRRLLRRHGVV